MKTTDQRTTCRRGVEHNLTDVNTLIGQTAKEIDKLPNSFGPGNLFRLCLVILDHTIYKKIIDEIIRWNEVLRRPQPSEPHN